MYCKGPLKSLLDPFFLSAPRRFHSNSNYHSNAYTAYTAGLSEDEQLRGAMQASLGPEGPQSPNREELRRRRLARYDSWRILRRWFCVTLFNKIGGREAVFEDRFMTSVFGFCLTFQNNSCLRSSLKTSIRRRCLELFEGWSRFSVQMKSVLSIR